MATKICNGPCGEEKDESAFSLRGRGRRRARCKPCVNKAATAGRQSDVERTRRLRNRFGITPERYDEMLAAQGGACAICGEGCASGRRLAVDHDHATGEVRGLLCMKCNTTLGILEQGNRLDQMLAYLSRE